MQNNWICREKKKRPYMLVNDVTIQILQYEFLGPIKLGEWGPPMEKVVYLILSRSKDSFNIIYAGKCEKTEDKKFFLDNPDFKCWIQTAGSENSLYLAILPMFESESSVRNSVLHKIILRYKPSCNPPEEKPLPDYVVRASLQNNEKNYVDNENEIVSCPCCGGQMNTDKILENTRILRCSKCGLSDTRINS